MAKKRLFVANFNVVFYEGEEEKSLLDYFDKIVMPAFTSGIVRSAGDATYRLMNVEIRQEENDFVLVGLIVKKTILEVKSDLTLEGDLIELDEKYPTAPFSTFIIYLKNHRMLYVENQKGSPNLKSFRATIQYIFNKYTRDLIKVAENEDNIPIPIINVVGIPTQEKLKDTLKKVEKIEKMTLRLYPLNGDLDITGIFEGFSSDLRRLVGSKNGEIVLKSPQNINGVLEVVEKSEGTVEPIFEVRYPNKRKGKVNNDRISERMEIEVNEGDITQEMDEIMERTKDIKNLFYVSEGNREIYEKNKNKIIPFYKK